MFSHILVLLEEMIFEIFRLVRFTTICFYLAITGKFSIFFFDPFKAITTLRSFLFSEKLQLYLNR